MPIDPNIIMGIRPAKIDPYDPVERQAKALGLQDLMRQNYQQEQAMADDQSMREAYRQSGGDANRLKQLLTQGGNYKGVQGIEKFNTDLGKTRAETSEKVAKVTHETIKQYRDAVSFVQTPDDAKQWLAAQYQNPNTAEFMNSIVPFEQALQRIPQNPAEFEQWKQMQASGMDEYLKRSAPKIFTQDTGGTSNIVSVPGMGGAPTVLSSTQKTMSPEQQANSPFTLGPDGRPVANVPVQQYQINKANAGANRMSVNMGLEREEQKEKGKSNVAAYNDIRTEANVARKLNGQIDVQTRVLESGFKTGWGKEAIAQGANFLTTMGIAPESATEMASNAQTFKAAAMEIVLQKQLAQKGPQTESDAKRIAETGPSLGNTPAANRFILDVAKAQNNRIIAQQQFFDNYWRTNKTYEGAENAWLSGDGAKSLFDEPVMRKYTKPTQQPQTNTKGWTLHTDAQGNKAYVSPDGKQFEEVQ